MTTRRPRDGGADNALGHRVGIQDVAQRLGLSTATVSLALNGKGTISQQTRERVMAEASRVGYVAHPFARGLRGGRSDVLALSIRSLDAAGVYRPEGVDHFSRMAGAAAFTALDRGFSLMLVPHRQGDGRSQQPMWVDGYVVEDPVADDPVVGRLLDAGIPVVTIGWDPARKSRTPWVSTHDRQANDDLLDLLASRGAERICFVSGSERNSWNTEAERAYRSWCRRHGMTVRLSRLPEAAGEAGGAELAGQLLDRADPPDAIYCQTGRHAAGAAASVKARGLRIPQDVMIAAGTDAEQARTCDPPITAIDLQPETLGREAVELLDGIVRHTPGPHRSRVIASRILERGSTGRVGRPATGGLAVKRFMP